MPTRVPFDLDELIRRSTSGKCFICSYLAKEIGYEHVLVKETESAVAFLSKYPTLFGYIIVAPRRHATEVTGSFSEREYLDLQRFIYQVGEAVRKVLAPERLYVLSLGSMQANSHVHWHVAPLPPGVPLEQQQYHALMHEYGVVETTAEEQERYAERVRAYLT